MIKLSIFTVGLVLFFFFWPFLRVLYFLFSHMVLCVCVCVLSLYILELYLWKCFEVFEIVSSRENCIFI